jgi:eukaryotic-like serine/threonine-protein kinase
MSTETQNRDSLFAKVASQTGMASAKEIEEAQFQQEKLLKSGTDLSLSTILINLGVITEAQRDTLEKKIQAQQTGGIQSLGNYKLLKKLGEGAMGAVFLAEDTVALRKVAVKVLPKKFAEDAAFLSRFRREAKAMGSLNHQNVVGAFAVGEELGHHFYVMEYCEGNPLDKVLQNEKSLPVERALEITMQAARGLQHAHKHGIIHRDIKPANMFITNDGLVKILDLGLSKNIADAEQSYMTQSGAVLGTPHYISPEQAMGQKEVDGRADIYSLGATLFHLLTGQTPYSGANISVILNKHMTEKIPNPQDIQPAIPDRVVTLLRHMMAKQPEARYQSCDQLIEDVERVIAGQPPLHTSVSASLELVPHAPPVRTGTGRVESISNSRASAQQQKQKPAGAPVLLYGVGALTAIAVTCFFMFKGSGQQNAAVTDTKTAITPQVGPNPGPSPVTTPAVNGDVKAVQNPDPAIVAKPNEVKNPAEVTASKRREEYAQRTLETIKLRIKEKTVDAATLRLQLRFVADEMKDTPAADEAKQILAAMDVVDAEKLPKAAPTDPLADEDAVVAEPANEGKAQAPVTEAANTAIQNAEKLAEEKRVKAQELYDQTSKEVSAALKNRKFSNAVTILDEKLNDAALSDFKEELNKDKTDIQAIIELRNKAYENLKEKKGTEITLGKLSGVVTLGKGDALTLKNRGVELPLPVTQLEFSHIIDLVPIPKGSDGIEILRQHGIMYLAAGDTDKAKAAFADATKRGGAEAVKRYTDQMDQKTSGDNETRAKATFDRAESAFNSKRWVEAKNAYSLLLKDYKVTQLVTASSNVIKKRLEAIERETTPIVWHNLLKKADLDKDSSGAHWRTENGEFLVNGNEGVLNLPYQPPEEYDFKVAITRKEGDGVFALIPCKGDQSFVFSIGVAQNRGVILGADTHARNVRFTRVDEAVFENGKRKEAEVRVRKDGVTAYLDGKEVASWKTDFKDTTSQLWEFRKDQTLLAIGLNWGQFTIHSIEVKEVTGKGKFTR